MGAVPHRKPTPQMRARYLFMNDVCKRLKCSRNVVKRYIEEGRLQATHQLGRWAFPREATERAIDRLLDEGGKLVLDSGKRDARAVAMLRAGASVADVVVDLELPIERVEELRRAQGPELAKAHPATEEDRERDTRAWERRRAERNARWKERRKVPA